MVLASFVAQTRDHCCHSVEPGLALGLAVAVDVGRVPVEPPAAEGLGPVGLRAAERVQAFDQVGEGVREPAAQQRLAFVFADQVGGGVATG